MSAQYYPEMNDPRLYIHFGYFTSKDHLREFFGAEFERENVEDHIKFITPMIEKTTQSVNKFRELQLREIEIVALIAISFQHLSKCWISIQLTII